MKERRRLEGADEQELDAITREIHAQLRDIYSSEVHKTVRVEPVQGAPHSGDVARFLAAFLLPPLAMLGLLLLLGLVKDGF